MYFADNVDAFTRDRARKKIITEEECTILSDFSVKKSLVIAWSIKESIYKIICKEGNKKAFNPRNIEITEFHANPDNSMSGYAGKAKTSCEFYFFNSTIFDQYVYSWATNNNESLTQVKNSFWPHTVNNNSVHNNLFIEYLKQKNWILEHNHDGIPYIKNMQNILDISISHENELMAISEFQLKTI